MGARCTQMWRTRRGAHARDHATPPRLRRASFLVAPANGTRCLYEITERAVFLNSIKENLLQVRRINFFLGKSNRNPSGVYFASRRKSQAKTPPGHLTGHQRGHVDDDRGRRRGRRRDRMRPGGCHSRRTVACVIKTPLPSSGVILISRLPQNRTQQRATSGRHEHKPRRWRMGVFLPRSGPCSPSSSPATRTRRRPRTTTRTTTRSIKEFCARTPVRTSARSAFQCSGKAEQRISIFDIKRHAKCDSPRSSRRSE